MGYSKKRQTPKEGPELKLKEKLPTERSKSKWEQYVKNYVTQKKEKSKRQRE
jgi:hypothetical protein